MKLKMMEEMTWEEFDKVRKEIKIALIPMGSMEEEGPHLPLGVDTIVALEVSKKVAEKIPVIVLPAISIGYSGWHQGFPGTLSLSIQTLTQMLREICGNLAEQGINQIIFVNPHVGNEASIFEVAIELRKNCSVRVAMFHLWAIANEMAKDIDTLVEKKFTHAGEIMTSVMLTLRPDLVNMEKAKKEFSRSIIGNTIQEGSLKIMFKNRHINFYCLSSEVTDSGIMGDPTHASNEKGMIIVNQWIEYICDFIREMKCVSIR